MKRLRFFPIPLAAALGAGMAQGATPPDRAKPETTLTLDRVARYPPPGSRIPMSFRFTHDGRYLYYLQTEGPGHTRVLIREEVEGGRSEVVARPPDTGGAGTLSREEILRRERLRLQDTGITQYYLAERADVVVVSNAGDLYLVRPGDTPLRLTETAATELTPGLSPDGRSVAFVREGDLFVIDLKTRETTRLTRGARDGVSHGLAEYIAQEEMGRHSGFWWAPDGSRIAYTEVDETGIPIFPIVHLGGTDWEVEDHRYPFAGGPNARVRLGVIPATGGSTVWLQSSSWDSDAYLARVTWSSDGALLVQMQNRDQKTLTLLRVDAGTGAQTVLLEERSKTWVNLHDDLRRLDDDRFLWSSEASGFRHLQLHSSKGRIERSLTSGEWSVDAVAGIGAGGRVYFTGTRDGPLQRQLYRVDLDGGGVERVTPEEGFHTVTLSPDGRFLIDIHDNVSTPPRVLLKTVDGRTLRVLNPQPDPEVESLRLRPPEFVTLERNDGVALHGAIYRPRVIKRGIKYPAIVRVYGGPGHQSVIDSWALTQDLRSQYLADHGYVVFRIDNRGTIRRGRAFEDAIYRSLGSVEVEDQIAGARYLGALPYVDASRVGLFGWSYGGYMAARCILQAPDIFRVAVAGAPVTDWTGYDTHYTERYMGTPLENAEGYRESSVLPLAANLQGKLLIIHGMVDENVHFRHTARLMNALNAAGMKYDVMLLPGERHLPRDKKGRRAFEARVVEYFDSALKSP